MLVSVFTSLPYNRKGGWAPGARSFKMSGFLKVEIKKELKTSKRDRGLNSRREMEEKGKKERKMRKTHETTGSYSCLQQRQAQLSLKLMPEKLYIF